MDILISAPVKAGVDVAGWSSLVARRAHNPEVVRFKSHPRYHLSGCNGFPLHPLLFLPEVLTRISFVSILQQFGSLKFNEWPGIILGGNENVSF